MCVFYTLPVAIMTGGVCTLVNSTVGFHVELIEVPVKPPVSSTTPTIYATFPPRNPIPSAMFTWLRCPNCCHGGSHWERRPELSGPPLRGPPLNPSPVHIPGSDMYYITSWTTALSFFGISVGEAADRTHAVFHQLQLIREETSRVLMDPGCLHKDKIFFRAPPTPHTHTYKKCMCWGTYV